MTDETISATTIINAPAEAIFAVLADSAKHAAIDGVLRGVGECGEDRLGWGVNDRGCADGLVGHGGASL